MRGSHQRDHGVLSTGKSGFHVAFEHGCEGFFVLPFRMLRGHLFDSIKDKERLHIHRLHAPERAVVVEGGDTLGGNNIAWRTLGRDPFDKGDD